LLAALVLMLLARELVLLAELLLALAVLLARESRALLVMMLLARALLVFAKSLRAQTPRESLVSLLPLEVFAACFESAVALGLS